MCKDHVALHILCRLQACTRASVTFSIGVAIATKVIKLQIIHGIYGASIRAQRRIGEATKCDSTLARPARQSDED